LQVPVIFDEVVCGFRLARGGSREWSGTQPHMSCFGKITSGLGIPLSMVAGEAEWVDTARTDGLFRDYGGGKVWISSTLAGNFLAVVAAKAQLDHLDEHYDEIMGRIDSNVAQLRQRIEDYSQRSGIPLSVQGHARTQLQLAFAKSNPAEHTYRGMMASSNPAQFMMLMAMTVYLRLHGVYVKTIPSLNLSAGHTEQDVSELARRIQRTIEHMARDGLLSELT
ncbi:MAG: aminotransferase class III-fold pyridoxal phosphate-dependent enzyme, partial [Gammaproteobacteria bacterium]|nr:aminotransferase class III-fold pyridoxal phosphate-dependent enzyme [Gammaproteobacteria bacterium]